MSIFPRPYLKDPDEVLDYRWDWTNRLAVSEVIQTSSFTVVPGGTLVIDSDSNDDTSATVWLSAGTRGAHYHITNRITTNQGRTYDWTITLSVRER